MAFVNTSTGAFLVGRAGSAGEYKEVGPKKTPLLAFSIAVGENSDGTTKWVDI